jgi:hypothetical protein
LGPLLKILRKIKNNITISLFYLNLFLIKSNNNGNNPKNISINELDSNENQNQILQTQKITNNTNQNGKIETIKILLNNKIDIFDSKIDINFTSIIVNETCEQEIGQILESKISLSNFLKPFMFDALKRFNRLSDIKKKILNFSVNGIEKWNFLNNLEERDLVCALIESVNKISKRKLGALIVKNDYPLPLIYPKFNIFSKIAELENVSFDLFQEILYITSRPLACVSGTKNAVFKGKTSIIPFIFNGLHEERSVFISKSNFPCNENCIDIICNEDTCDWIIADFHSKVETHQAKSLLKSFAAYSSIHVINATIEDFNKDGEPIDELKELLIFHVSLTAKSFIIILLRDFEAKFRNKLNLIQLKLLEQLDYNQITLFTLENLSNSRDEMVKIKKDNLFKKINLIKRRIEIKPMHSINEIKLFYEKISTNSLYKNNEFIEIQVEKDFNSLFINHDYNFLKEIFPIAHSNSLIKEQSEYLNKFDINTRDRDKAQNNLKKLNNERMNIKKPITDIIKYFIEIVLKENFVSELILFENCLINFKKEKLKVLRNQRKDEQNTVDELNQKLKKKERNTNNQNNEEIKKLKEEIARRKISILNLNDQIELLDLTVDKFWDEVFSIYDWIVEKEKSIPFIDPSLKQNVESFKNKMTILVDRYINLFENGYAVHILRGKPLNLESKSLEMVFEKLKKRQEIYIITVIGEQSSAKSSLMNSLFGCDFRTSAGRCTVGMYMNFVNYKDKKIVILDSEGLMSIESGNSVLDNQLGTMAVLSSHLIIINHKGEISSNLEKLLGITFYAKLHTSKSIFKPSILFVLRDQTTRNSSSVSAQVSQLKEKLNDQVSQMEKSINDVLSIDTENMVLLPNAFSEEKFGDQVVKWRNSLFPDEILKLRKKLIETLENMNKTGHEFNELLNIYYSMSSYWKTLTDLGYGILMVKDLEELKLRNEIATRSSKIYEKINKLFYDDCQKIITSSKEKGLIENIDTNTTAQIDDKYDHACKSVVQEFKDTISINNSHFENIVNEYETGVKNGLERTKTICLNQWKNYYSNLRETDTIEKMQNNFIAEVSKLILSGKKSNNFVSQIQVNLKQHDGEFDKSLESLKNINYVEKIQFIYNSTHNQNIFTKDLKHFQCLPKIWDLENVFKHFDIKNIDEFLMDCFKNVNEQNIFEKFVMWCKFKNEKNERFELINWILPIVKEKITKEVKFVIKSSHVEDVHVRNTFFVINNYFFQMNSPIIRYRDYINIHKLLLIVSEYAFYHIFKEYIKNRDKEISEIKEKYESKKNDLIEQATKAYNNMDDANKSGKNTFDSFYEKVYEQLHENSKENAKKEISNKLFQVLKNTDELMDQAFKKSFEAFDYNAVYKYVTNIVDYCNDVSESLTKESIRVIIANEKEIFRKKLNDFIDTITFISGLKLYKSTSTIYQFIDEIITQFKDPNLKDILQKAKKAIYDGKIQEIEHFSKSFFNNVTEKLLNLELSLKTYNESLEKYAKETKESDLKKIIGCPSKCPGCGSKCTQDIGHKGSHKAFKHVYNGFSGWSMEDTKKIILNYCWEGYFYLGGVIYPINGKREHFKSFKDLLEKHFDTWSYDVETNYIKFGKEEASKNKAFNDFDFFVKKCWMNVRNAVLRYYSLYFTVYDKEYDSAWKLLEEKDNMLL